MIKTIVVEDEALARERMKDLLKEHPEIVVIDEAENGIEAIEKIELQSPELVFLDIEMPGCNGIEVVKSLTTRPFPRIIFCTAYDQYAIQAFELNAIDYLLKPVSRPRLAEALKRVTESTLTERGFHRKLNSVVSSFKDRRPEFMARFLGRRAKKIYVITEADVIYFNVDRSLVFIITDTGEYWTNYSLSQLEQSINPDTFFRVHRKSIVNLNKIREMAPLIGGTYQLTMANGAHVEVSRRQSTKLLDLLK